MPTASRFNTVLEAVEQLSPDEQETLLNIVRKRLSDRRRQQIIADVREGEKEIAAGRLKTVSVEELMDEIDS